MRLDNVAFNMVLLQGGSMVAPVVEVVQSDGSIKKNIGNMVAEPLVFDVTPGSPVDAWLKSTLTGSFLRKSGSLVGGIVPAQQELDFVNGMLTSVTIPTLDAASNAPAFLRIGVAPEYTRQNALSGTTSGSLPGWVASDFSFAMDNLETTNATRIEPFAIKSVLTETLAGDQRTYTTSPTGPPKIPNLFVTFTVDATHPATNWLAWYDDFVIKGNSTDDKEKTFTLSLGVGTSGAARLTLKGYGVGIVALRTLPSSGFVSVRRLQAELYVERVEVNP